MNSYLLPGSALSTTVKLVADDYGLLFDQADVDFSNCACSTPSSNKQNDLLKRMVEAFDINDLKTLCFTLGIMYDDLGGETQSQKAQELISYHQKRCSMTVLLNGLKKERSRINWETFVEFIDTADPLVTKSQNIIQSYEFEKPSLYAESQSNNTTTHLSETEMPTMIELEFTNRTHELHFISNPARSPLMIIDAPAGYGKTQLFLTLKQSFKQKQWKCTLTSLDICQGKIAIRKSIASQLDLTLADPKAEMADFKLKEQIGTVKQPLLLLFDSVEEATDDDLSWLIDDFIPGCIKSLQGFSFRVIFAGRYMQAGARSSRWLGYDRVSLSPFTKQVIRQIVEELAFQNLFAESERLDDITKHIMNLSGGHPRSIQRLLTKFVANNWVMPATEKEEKHLFEECTGKEIPIVIETLDAKIQEALYTVFIFRLFTTSALRYLQEKQQLPQGADPLVILSGLTAKRLIAKCKDSPFYSDQIVRKLIITQLRIFKPQRYKDLHKVAQDFYEKWINLEIQKDTDQIFGFGPGELVPILVKENVYHICQQYPHCALPSNIAIKCLRENSSFLIKALGRESADPDRHQYLKDLILQDEEIRESFEGCRLDIDFLFEVAFDSDLKEEKMMDNTSRRHIGDWMVDTLDMLRHNAQNVLIERWEKRNQGKAITPPVFADRKISPEQLASVSREELAETLPEYDVLKHKLNGYQDASGRIVLINEKYMTNLKEQMESAQATKGEYELELTRALSPNERIQAKQGFEESQKKFDEAAQKLADIYAYIYSD